MNGQVKMPVQSESVRDVKAHIGIDPEKNYMINRPPCRKCGLTVRKG